MAEKVDATHDRLLSSSNSESSMQNCDDETPESNLSTRAQRIVDSLNAKRQRDTKLMTEFKAALHAQVEKICGALEQHVYSTYDKQSSVFNEKLQEIFSCLQRVETLNMELQEFKQDLRRFFQEME